MSSPLVRLVRVVVAVLLGFGAAGTTTANAVGFAYDAPTIAVLTFLRAAALKPGRHASAMRWRGMPQLPRRGPGQLRPSPPELLPQRG